MPYDALQHELNADLTVGAVLNTVPATRQRTLAGKVECSGVGVHSGEQVSLSILPAPEDHGIVFVQC